MNTIKNIIIGILLLLSFISVLFQFVAFNQVWYETEFKILHIPINNKTPGQLENLLSYLKKSEPLDKSFYTEREILHLLDIQYLIRISKIISLIFLGITFMMLMLVFLIQHGLGLIKTIFYSNLTALISYGLVLGLLYLKFDYLFILFHQLAFNNDYWMLDPSTDNLINIFPPQLFADLLQQVFGLAILAHLTLFTMTGFVLAITLIKRSHKA